MASFVPTTPEQGDNSGSQGAQGSGGVSSGGAQGSGDKLVAPITPAESISGTKKGGCDNSQDDDCSGSSQNYNIDRDIIVGTQSTNGRTRRFVALDSSTNQQIDQNAKSGAANGSEDNLIIQITNARRPLQFENHSTLKRLPVREVKSQDQEHGRNVEFNSYSYLEAGIKYDSSGSESCYRTSNGVIYARNFGNLSYNNLQHIVSTGPPYVLGETHTQTFTSNDLPESNPEVLRNDGFCFIAKVAADQAAEYGTVFIKFNFFEHKDKMTKYVINNRMYTMGDRTFGRDAAQAFTPNFGDPNLTGYPGTTDNASNQYKFLNSHILSGRFSGMGDYGHPGAVETFPIDDTDDYDAWAKSTTGGNLLNRSLYRYGNIPQFWKNQPGGNIDIGASHWALNWFHRQIFREGIYHNRFNSSLNQLRYGPRLHEVDVNGDFGQILQDPHNNKDYFPNFHVFNRSNQSLDFTSQYRSWNALTQNTNINWNTGFNNIGDEEDGLDGNLLWFEPFADNSGGRFYKSPAFWSGVPFNSNYFVSNLVRADFSWRPITIIIYKGTVDYNNVTGRLFNFSDDYVEYGRYRTFNTNSGSEPQGFTDFIEQQAPLETVDDGPVRYKYRKFQYPINNVSVSSDGNILEVYKTQFGNNDDSFIKINFSDLHNAQYEETGDLKVMIFQDVSSLRKSVDNSNQYINNSQKFKTPDDWTVSFRHPSQSYNNLPLFYPKYNETYQFLKSRLEGAGVQGQSSEDVSYVRGYINTFTEDSWHAHTIFKNQGWTVGTGPDLDTQKLDEGSKILYPPYPWDIEISTTKRGGLIGVHIDPALCPSNRTSFHASAGSPYCGECKGFSPLVGGDSYYSYGNLISNTATYFDDGSAANYTPYAVGYPWSDSYDDHRSYVRTYDGDSENINWNPFNTD